MIVLKLRQLRGNETLILSFPSQGHLNYFKEGWQRGLKGWLFVPSNQYYFKIVHSIFKPVIIPNSSTPAKDLYRQGLELSLDYEIVETRRPYNENEYAIYKA